ncbi:Hypothetical protein PBC10988_40320 [Planctomycetales bacterium 10988]|nr:Hypothetical protein PBC10988_40320 [Planctomycetales bacterium 10988]
MKRILPLFAGLSLLGLTPIAEAANPLTNFSEKYCSWCHNEDGASGEVDLGPIAAAPQETSPAVLQKLFDAITLGEMPPQDEEQPTPAERQEIADFLSVLLAQAGAKADEKMSLPGYGNYVDHEKLFTEPEVRKAATPARLWRMSPHIFMDKANRVTRSPLLRPQRNQGGDGLHPAFAYMTPPHTFRDHSEIHEFEEATTELLFDICWQIAGIQVNSRRMPRPMQEIIKKRTITERDWSYLIRYQYASAMQREPTSEETERLIALGEQTSRDASQAEAIQTVLAAVLLQPDAVYRFEVGQGEPDEWGRVHLAPYELMNAVSYALTDSPPDNTLKAAAERGQLEDRRQVERHVKRLLNTPEKSMPRLLRFFQEYFEYPRAAEVFKDARRANAIFVNERIEDADMLVEYVLKEDREVLKRLLTEKRFFVMGPGMPNREPPERRARLYYLPDFGFPRDWTWERKQPLEPLEGHRSGILTHPAWLMAFSDNEKNQAIQRGRWIWMKLLGGTVPDTPIGVDAKLPTDPHLTLREKMHVTKEQYCWRCHQRMDPLGLPLEQFDDFGRYREQELNRPVETTGTISVGDPDLDGPVENPYEMLDRLANSERVEQVFVRHAFRYFLGRNETIEDAPTLIDAHRAYQQSGGSMKALVTSLLISDSFLYRRLPTNTVATLTSELD